MKRFIHWLALFFIKMSLLILTFYISVTITFLWFEISPPIVTLCEVAENPKQYEGRNIRLSAPVQTHFGMLTFTDETCNFLSFNSVVTLPKEYKPESQTVQDFLSDGSGNFFSSTLLITGRIDASSEIKCDSPKFEIKATKLEIISEISKDSDERMLR